MTISDLNHMEARVEIGEMDINLIKLGQKSWLEVDAFRERKFAGTVTQIANTASGSSGTDATKFEVRILIDEKEAFRPGMSVTAEVETRYRTNVLSVPIQSVTTRMRLPQNWRPRRPQPIRKTDRRRRHFQLKRMSPPGLKRSSSSSTARASSSAKSRRHQRRQLYGNRQRPGGGRGSGHRRLQSHQQGPGRRQADQGSAHR